MSRHRNQRPKLPATPRNRNLQRFATRYSRDGSRTFLFPPSSSSTEFTGQAGLLLPRKLIHKTQILNRISVFYKPMSAGLRTPAEMKALQTLYHRA
jgi:hypothetical protein